MLLCQNYNLNRFDLCPLLSFMILILYTVPLSYFIKLLSFPDSEDERLKLKRLHDPPSAVPPIVFNYIFVLFTLQSVCQGWLSETDLFTACILIINQSHTRGHTFQSHFLRNFFSIEWNNFKKEVKVVRTVYVGGGGGGWWSVHCPGQSEWPGGPTVASLDSGVTDQLSPSPHLRPQ